ncbi:EAL domain-containing protein [Nitratireductor sp. ZSWI3]|uniref:EAL domain-containing protein n=1 Tax=Nitratireductor sp. ZSWI3 TaxID=2966359 RepID=UPI00214F65B8|nr:EAL domain-containing protein [Nitratireductor sp. ZSWI3]MCR4267906.1 EAL domain-containing protein [Nitratireductor sp. ZSWI3]
MPAANVPGLPGGSIVVDEIGIETGRFGPYHLKSVYQAIYHVAEDVLTPCAVEGFVQPQIDFEPVAPETFFAAVAPEMQARVKALCRGLHIGNHHHIGADHVMLHLNCEPGLADDRDEAFAQIDFMAERADQVDLRAEMIVCGFVARDISHEGVPDSLAKAMRAAGFGLAVDDFGPGHSVLDRIQRIRPDVVKIDGAWFRRIADLEAAARLLAKLVAGLHRDGARVLVKGIETAEQLDVALSVGADMVQGYLLSRPAMAGMMPDLKSVEIKRFFRDPQKVVIPLR